MLDMATSVAAQGKLDVAKDKGIQIPPGWALAQAGKPTTDPHAASVLLPTDGNKGSDLALLFECLTSLLAGNPLLTPAFQGKPNAQVHRQNSVVAAVTIAMLTGLESYRANADATMDGIEALPPAEGFSEVLVPGEPENRVHRRQRLAASCFRREPSKSSRRLRSGFACPCLNPAPRRNSLRDRRAI